MTKGGKWAALFKTTYYKPQKCSGKWTFNHTGIRTTKGRRFFWRFSATSLKVKCPCYLSNWYNRHWRCSPRSSVKNCSICFLETELVEQQFAVGLKKEDCLFPIIYKDQLAANTIFIFYLFMIIIIWPFLSFLKDLQKILWKILLFLRSKVHKRAVNRITKRLLTKWCFILTPSP